MTSSNIVSDGELATGDGVWLAGSDAAIGAALGL